MPLLIVTSARFAEHMTPPGHPERYQRAEALEAVALSWKARGGEVAEPSPAARAALERVHAGRYLDALDALRGRSAMLDADTFTSPESLDVAALAAGAAIAAADHALDGRGPAIAFVRPPGHHAGPDRAMGFCLYNNVAVAAAHARARGAGRVAIVDIDVHHGNGTQAIFYGDPDVLYVSLHQFPFYPGTGAADEVGEGAGAGFTVNVPLEAGATDADYLRVHGEVVAPVLESFRPELLLVSAGYDAHENDPLGGMRVTTAGYGMLLRRLRDAAEATCGGRLAVVTEGGYDLDALAACGQGTVDALDSGPVPVAAAPGDTARAEAALAGVRRAQRPYWPAL